MRTYHHAQTFGASSGAANLVPDVGLPAESRRIGFHVVTNFQACLIKPHYYYHMPTAMYNVPFIKHAHLLQSHHRDL